MTFSTERGAQLTTTTRVTTVVLPKRKHQRVAAVEPGTVVTPPATLMTLATLTAPMIQATQPPPSL
jgi:hypothetical protein